MPTPEPTGAALHWRPPRREDLPAWLELVQQTQRADGEHDLIGAEELAADFDDGTWSASEDARLVAAPDGTLVADAVVSTVGTGREFVRLFCSGTVHPAWRGRGLGRELFGWQLRRAGQRYAALEAEVPGMLEAGCPVGHPAGRLFERFGLAPVRYWSHMAHDLAELPVVRSDGLPVRRYREELSERVRRAHNEAFTDHWGSAERTTRSWREMIVGHPLFRPELSFVVLDGIDRDPTVAAYLMSYQNEPNEPGGRASGYIGQIGTRRAWRGRGLASALVVAALAAMRDAGYRRATLTVDTASPTGAHGLYERLGFVTEQQYVSYQRPVAAPAPGRGAPGPAAAPGGTRPTGPAAPVTR
jgi:mycothiol synthase